MKRGEVWTQAGGPGYAGKPRPVIIIQSDKPHPNPSPEGEGLYALEAEAGMEAMSEVFKEKGGEIYLPAE